MLFNGANKVQFFKHPLVAPTVVAIVTQIVPATAVATTTAHETVCVTTIAQPTAPATAVATTIALRIAAATETATTIVRAACAHHGLNFELYA